MNTGAAPYPVRMAVSRFTICRTLDQFCGRTELAAPAQKLQPERSVEKADHAKTVMQPAAGRLLLWKRASVEHGADCRLVDSHFAGQTAEEPTNFPALLT